VVSSFVSIVIPAWNVAPFIGAAIDHALAQHWSRREVIVVNDGSPDTPALDAAMRGYSGRADVTYLKQSNAGPSGARNTGIRAARGDLIAFLDGDDYWDAEYLARQVDHLERDAHLDLVYCDARLFGVGPLAGRTFMDGAPSNGEPTLERLIAMEVSVPTTCVVARRAAIERAGLFDERFRRCEDYDLWLRMSAMGSRMTFHRAVLAWHRLHAASAAADRTAMFESQALVYAKLQAMLGPGHPCAALVSQAFARASADAALERGKRHLAARRYREAAADLDAAHAFYGTRKLALARLALRGAPALVRKLYVG